MIHLLYNPYTTDYGVKVYMLPMKDKKVIELDENFEVEDLQEGVVYFANGGDRFVKKLKTVPKGIEMVTVVTEKRLWFRERGRYHLVDLSLNFDKLLADYPDDKKLIERYRIDSKGLLWKLYLGEKIEEQGDLSSKRVLELILMSPRLKALRLTSCTEWRTIKVEELHFLCKELLYLKTHSSLELREGLARKKGWSNSIIWCDFRKILCLYLSFPATSLEDLIIRYHIELEGISW